MRHRNNISSAQTGKDHLSTADRTAAVYRDPLRRRFLRELKHDFSKYLVLFLLLTFSIGFISGFLVAAGSMLKTYNDGFEKYRIENGNFLTEKEMNRAQRKAIEKAGVTIFDLLHINTSCANGSTLRIYPQRTEVDLLCLMEGRMPQAGNEIAVDRMYADNNNLSVGDVITQGSYKDTSSLQESSGDAASAPTAREEEGTQAEPGGEWVISGLVAFPDYSCLFENNNDSMFDAVKFGVAVVSPEAFDSLTKENDIQYGYAWLYEKQPDSKESEKEMADDLLDVLREEVHIKSFTPRYLNKSIQFTGEDMRGDSSMMTALLYIITGIIAFVFVITISTTISEEAGVIGTLRASGYTRGELLRHYMTLPVVVTCVSAVVGNVLGYTVFKYICADMYYGSYSLPTYVTVWNAEAFLKTTVVPLLLVAVISFLILFSKLRLSPLDFLRRNLRRGRRRKAVPLPAGLPFFTRFRIRVILQNAGNYLVLLAGILFANLLLMFGLGLPAVLNDYMDKIGDQMLCNYQYFLTVPADAVDENEPLMSAVNMLLFSSEIETENEDAEKFSIFSLQSQPQGSIMAEEILLYGIPENSRYVPLDFSDDKVYITSTYAEKYRVSPGDTITLEEEFEDSTYTFTVSGIFDYNGSVAVFGGQEFLNRTFDEDESFFCGYLSDTEITDISEEYIGTVLDYEALTKITRQLQVSFGSMMNMVDVFAVVVFVILIFLLSKIIIEKNAQSISLTKILGYTNSEISRLYIVSTTLVVIASILISLPLIRTLIVWLMREVLMAKMTGWIPLKIPYPVYIKTAVLGIVSYAAVAAVEMRRIRRIPMDAALKNVE